MKKRITGIVLCVVLLFSTAAPVSAKGFLSSTPEYPLVVVRGMDFSGLYIDEGTENERPALGEIDATGIIKTLILAGISGSFDGVINQALVYVKSILGNLACDNTGASIYNVSPHRYPGAISSYPNFEYENINELGIVKKGAELYGGDNVYYFTYDWRMNPLDIADEIAETVNLAIAETGKSKVNLVCCSMGGVMTVAYMTKYGYENLNKCVFISSTAGGVDLVSDLLQGKVVIDSQALFNMVEHQVKDSELLPLINVLNVFGVFGAVSSFANDIVETYKRKVFDEFLIDTFGHMLSLWALVQPEDYSSAVEFMFGGKEDEYELFIQKTDEIQEMMKNRDGLLKEAKNNGVDIAVTTSYNFPGIPLHERAAQNGDGTLDAKGMSLGATVANYGKTFDDEVINSGSSYVSADGVINAESALFPNSTWFFKDSPHVGCSYGTEQSDFLFWLLETPNATVNSNWSYPQFSQSSGDMTIAPLY
ncbi:MAG TPA: hypothetical protein VFC76_00255 [Oscillospiraceae bacterium]|nr:hypothetical protein [Oscillospiraceae bacterium]